MAVARLVGRIVDSLFDDDRNRNGVLKPES